MPVKDEARVGMPKDGLTNKQRERLELVMQPNYEGYEQHHLGTTAGLSAHSASHYLDSIVERLGAENLFHAGCNALQRNILSIEGFGHGLEERARILNPKQLHILRLLYPQYDVEAAAQILIMTQSSFQAELEQTYRTLGLSNPSQLAPLAYYVATHQMGII